MAVARRSQDHDLWRIWFLGRTKVDCGYAYLQKWLPPPQASMRLIVWLLHKAVCCACLNARCDKLIAYSEVERRWESVNVDWAGHLCLSSHHYWRVYRGTRSRNGVLTNAFGPHTTQPICAALLCCVDSSSISIKATVQDSKMLFVYLRDGSVTVAFPLRCDTLVKVYGRAELLVRNCVLTVISWDWQTGGTLSAIENGNCWVHRFCAIVLL